MFENLLTKCLDLFVKGIHAFIGPECPWSRPLKDLNLRLFVSFLFDETKD